MKHTWTIEPTDINKVKAFLVLGNMSLGGDFILVEKLAESLQVAFDSRAKRLLLPMASVL